MEPDMATQSGAAQKNAKTYSSPWRVLARVFEKSRDNWKKKYLELQERVRAFRTELRDLRRSRDRWRAEAAALKQQLQDLHDQTQRQAEQSPPAPSWRLPQLRTRHLN
jgi:septal ring factor EnvC (AmiA/AmiB activator)